MENILKLCQSFSKISVDDKTCDTKAMTVSFPFAKHQNLDSSKLKEFADKDFELHETGGKVLQKGRKHWEKEKMLVTNI